MKEMKHLILSRIRRVWAVVAVLVLTTLLYFAWSLVVNGAAALQSAAPPAAAGVEAEPILPPLTAVAQASCADSVPASARLRSPASALLSQPCASTNGCPPLTAKKCNTVFGFDTSVPQATQMWDNYNCMDTSVFTANTLTYKEVGYTVKLTEELDLSLAVPLVVTQGQEAMNVFAAILTDCDNNACVAGSENRELVIYRHAIYPSAPARVYTTVVDSDNMNGYGEMIIACGNPNPGWCEDVVSADITCSNYTINGTTNGGPDDIIYYDARYWVDNLAYDGPERVYRIALTQPRIFTFTLHYSGSATLPYYNYMSYFILDDACDQRDVWDNPGPPHRLRVGEGTSTTTYSTLFMSPGTYYLVVDGVHMPTQGDAFQLDVECLVPYMVYLPLVLKN
jgi:hypothetical protein